MLLSTVPTHTALLPHSRDRIGPRSHESSRTAYIVTDNQRLGIDLETALDTYGVEARWFRSASAFLAYKQPDVLSCLLIGQTLLDMSGLDLQRRLAHIFSPPIIFLSDDGDIPSCVRAIKEGALDCLALPLVPSRFTQAMETAFNRHASALTIRRDNEILRNRWHSLTSREAEVMRYVVEGFLNKQTAGELGIAENTVQVHRGRVMKKMRADSLASLVCMALRLVECDEPSLLQGFHQNPGDLGILYHSTGNLIQISESLGTIDAGTGTSI